MKADSGNTFCQKIWIGSDRLHGPVSEDLKNLHGHSGGQTKLLQIHHCLTGCCFRSKLFTDLCRFLLTDPLNKTETFRLSIEHMERLLFKHFYDSPGQCLSHTFDDSG